MTTVTNKNGIEFNIDAIATDLNNKVDLDGTNATYPHIVSRTANSQRGIVEIWSDGYCVQTGIVSAAASGYTVDLPYNYKDTNYIVNIIVNGLSTFSGTYYSMVDTITTTSFNIKSSIGTNTTRFSWRTEGYIR